MALPTGLGQRALQSLNRPSALQFIGTPQMGAPATQPVPQNIMGLRQRVLEQQMRPQLTPAQQFRQLAGISAAERMGQTPPPPPPKAPTGMDGLLSGFMPEAGTPEMAGYGAAGQKLLELSGYRAVPITIGEALGQAAGAYGQARGAALQQQKEQQAAQAAAERQAAIDLFDRNMREQQFLLEKRKQEFAERPTPAKYGTVTFGDDLYQTIDGQITSKPIATKKDKPVFGYQVFDNKLYPTINGKITGDAVQTASPVSDLPKIGEIIKKRLPNGMVQDLKWDGKNFQEFGDPYSASEGKKFGGFVTVIDPVTGDFVKTVEEGSPESLELAEQGYRIIESTQLTGGAKDVNLASGLTKSDHSKQVLAAFSAEKNIQDLEMIKATYSPEFQTLGGKAKRIGLEVWDMIDPDTTTKEGREYLTSVTEWKTRAWNQINDYIKEITGAQMSEAEARRILRSLPDPDDDFFSVTSPTVYMAALNTAIDEAKLASARTKYFLAKGLKPEFVKTEKTELNNKGFNVRFIDEEENLIRTWDGSMQKVISKEAKSLLSKYKDLPSEERVGAVNTELYRLFGLQPADVKKYLSQTGV